MPYPLPSQFTYFADAECRETSPLYHHLAHAIAADDALLELAAHALPGQPAPNLLLAAVHLLLASAPDAHLRAFYATFNNPPADPTLAFPIFRHFALAHRAEISPSSKPAASKPTKSAAAPTSSPPSPTPPPSSIPNPSP